MSRTYLIRLEENELGQILDGLRAREATWRATAQYQARGYLADDSIAIEACRDEAEATRIADFYTRIIHDLERQRGEQHG
jgi:hypothetical protein